MQACWSAFFTTIEISLEFDFWDLLLYKSFNVFMILTDLKKKNLNWKYPNYQLRSCFRNCSGGRCRMPPKIYFRQKFLLWNWSSPSFYRIRRRTTVVRSLNHPRWRPLRPTVTSEKVKEAPFKTIVLSLYRLLDGHMHLIGVLPKGNSEKVMLFNFTSVLKLCSIHLINYMKE